jgi:hypothetical protein
MRWAKHVACMGERKITYRILMWKPELKSPLQRPMRRCDNNIKKHFEEMGLEVMDWIYLA